MSSRTQRRALITGGASGFGLATARALLEQGSQVAIGDVNTGQLGGHHRLRSAGRNPRGELG